MRIPSLFQIQSVTDYGEKYPLQISLAAVVVRPHSSKKKLPPAFTSGSIQLSVSRESAAPFVPGRRVTVSFGFGEQTGE